MHVIELYRDIEECPTWIQSRIAEDYGSLDDTDWIVTVQVSTAPPLIQNADVIAELFPEKLLITLPGEEGDPREVWLVNHA